MSITAPYLNRRGRVFSVSALLEEMEAEDMEIQRARRKCELRVKEGQT